MSTLLRATCLLPLIFSSSVFAGGYTQCYYPDGSIPLDYVWFPCKSGVANSACCAQGDICQDNGLCYYPNADPGKTVYRGACTDRTFNDPSCNANICLNGFETTWVWTEECGAPGSNQWACGPWDGTSHTSVTCPGSQPTVAYTYQTTRTTSTAGRFTPPPSVDTAIYTVITSTLQATISAFAQETTYTTTWQTTQTRKINAQSSGSSTATGTGTNAAVSATSTGKTHPEKVAIGMGLLIAIIAAPIMLLIFIGVGVFLCIRKRRTKKDNAIRLNSGTNQAPFPPPNGPVGADQTYPYEAPLNEVKPGSAHGGSNGYYTPVPGPKVDTYEIDDPNAQLREKYQQQNLSPQQQQNFSPYAGQNGNGSQNNPNSQYGQVSPNHSPYPEKSGVAEMMSPVTPLRSPAPAYSQIQHHQSQGGIEPVEMDAGYTMSATGGWGPPPNQNRGNPNGRGNGQGQPGMAM